MQTFKKNDKYEIIYQELFKSSRPKELPLQSLTEPDVNLSIYPALIDQPQAVYTANEGKGLVHAVQFG